MKASERFNSHFKNEKKSKKGKTRMITILQEGTFYFYYFTINIFQKLKPESFHPAGIHFFYIGHKTLKRKSRIAM